MFTLERIENIKFYVQIAIFTMNIHQQLFSTEVMVVETVS